MQLHPKAMLVAGEGASLTFIQDGEVLGCMPLRAGKTPAREVLGLVGPGVNIEPQGDVFVVNPRSWFGKQAYGQGSHDSGANPDFKVTSASRMERELRLTLMRMQAATARVEAREAALAKVERIPKAPKDDGEVIEREAATAKPVETPKADGATE